MLSVVSRLLSTISEVIESVNIWMTLEFCGVVVAASLSAIMMAASSACSVEEPSDVRKEAVLVLVAKPHPAV